MEITWYGHSCFRLTERGLASVVTDPFDDTIGYSTLRLKAEVVTVSHDAPGHNNADAVKGEKRIIRGPGEFEIGGVFITGVATRRAASGQESKTKTPEKAIENTLYLFNFNGLNVAHLGDLNYVPTQQQIESLGAVDVLLVPVGGGGALTASQAAEMVSLLEPSVVVPMHYKTPEVDVKLESLNKFLKEMGLSGIKPLDSLKIGHSDLPDETRVVVLDYKRG
ncbi:MAG: MBL fold metallo-hydrolase [Anaerolineales bacterium]|jgi:L-ascorbate metabolism protein UlaG (beta-lactamase superfamily)